MNNDSASEISGKTHSKTFPKPNNSLSEISGHTHSKTFPKPLTHSRTHLCRQCVQCQSIELPISWQQYHVTLICYHPRDNFCRILHDLGRAMVQGQTLICKSKFRAVVHILTAKLTFALFVVSYEIIANNVHVLDHDV